MGRTCRSAACVTVGAPSNPISLAAGATDYLSYTISLPTSADNNFQGKSASLSLVFTGTQRTGTTR